MEDIKRYDDQKFEIFCFDSHTLEICFICHLSVLSENFAVMFISCKIIEGVTLFYISYSLLFRCGVAFHLCVILSPPINSLSDLYFNMNIPKLP